MKIAFFGIGSFGYALLKHFDEQENPDFDLHAYDRNPQLIEHLNKHCRHLIFHKETEVSCHIKFHNNVQDLLQNSDILILAVSSDALEEISAEIKTHLPPDTIIVNTAKALQRQTGERLSKVVMRALGNPPNTYAVLAGGTIATDLFHQEPLGADIACVDEKALAKLVQVFSSRNLFVYPTTDVMGVEYASALKNVISVLAGITNGMGFSYGAETHIISRAAYEVERVVTEELGGKPETFRMNSQCWGNDLWMSCTGNTRNREFGILLGRGLSVEDAQQKMQQMNKMVESIPTIHSLPQVFHLGQYPLLRFLHGLLNGKTTLQEIKNIIFNHEF